MTKDRLRRVKAHQRRGGKGEGMIERQVLDFGALEKSNFQRHFNVIWVVQSPIIKIFRFSINPNQWFLEAIPFP